MALTPSTMLVLGSKAADFRLWKTGCGTIGDEDFDNPLEHSVTITCKRLHGVHRKSRRTHRELALPLLLLFTAVSLVNSSFANAQEPYFPDLVFLPKNKDLNSLIDNMTSVHLKAMREPSLWKMSEKNRTSTVYRFLWLASGQHPISMRLTRSDGTYILHVAQHDGPPGITAGQLSTNKDVKLSAQEGERIVAQIEGTKFWTSPVSVKESTGIADGDRIVIEGLRDGKYHVISRAGLTTGESYKDFSRALLVLADEPNLLKIWDVTRQAERGRPGYEKEPSQTLHDGAPFQEKNAEEPGFLPKPMLI